jgi:hypothetical protein
MSMNDGSSGSKGGPEILTQVNPEILKVVVGLIQGASISTNDVITEMM